ncbi:MAG: methyltransferase domain-containing protein [Rhodospirillaceae bacterium]|nr:methyltransferase domain-containing protein [Rhodospirillaceae bacterium]
MTKTSDIEPNTPRHLRITDPSPWVARFAPLIKKRGTALDLACGGGRHARYLLGLGLSVVLVDRNTEAVADLAENPYAEIITCDLEDGSPAFADGGPLAGRAFDAVIVSNYLYRPLFEALIGAVSPGGIFIYETFARGNERYAKPRNPDHLLKSGELLDVAAGHLQVIAYEHGIIEKGPIPGVIQRISAVRDPQPHPVLPD